MNELYLELIFHPLIAFHSHKAPRSLYNSIVRAVAKSQTKA